MKCKSNRNRVYLYKVNTMKRISVIVLGFFLMIMSSFLFIKNEEKYPTLELDASMPLGEHYMLNVDEQKLYLNKLKKDNGLLVVFSCNTCPFVIQWEDRYNEIANIALANNIGMVLINSNEAKRSGEDSFTAMKDHAEKQQYKMPYLRDDKSMLANAFGAKTTPHVFLFNADDKLVYKGAIDDNSRSKEEVSKHYLLDALKALALGKEISPAETPAKGCSIKRIH